MVRHARRRAFSLQEVLVVFAVMALFVTLVLPALGLATESARKIACENKLRQIGIAYADYSTRFPTGMNANEWMKILLPELDASGFECPNDRQDRDFTCVEDYSVYIVNVNYSIMLKDGPWAKVAEAPSFAITEPTGNVVDCRTSYGDRGQGPLQGSSTPVPGGYFVLFEDAYSWNSPWDGILYVQPFNDGNSIRITETGENSHYYTHRLIGPQNEVLLNPLQRGGSIEISADAVTSYGVNGSIKRFTTDGNKIVATEYNKPIADVVGPAAIGIFFWDSDVEPRHLGGTLNVLFGDGHVETKTATDIDPRVPWMHNLYWCPTVMPIIPINTNATENAASFGQ